MCVVLYQANHLLNYVYDTFLENNLHKKVVLR